MHHEIKPHHTAHAITPQARAAALTAFGIPDAPLFARGTEAEVYPYDDQMLLKLYAGVDRLPQLTTLQQFYAGLDSSSAPFSIPQIKQISAQESLIVTLEARMQGTPLERLLPNLDATGHQHAARLYLESVFAVQTLRPATPPTHYALFDTTDTSATQRQSFNAFYADLVDRKRAQVAQHITPILSTFPEQATALVAALRAGKTPELAVIHGDFFAGNLLVSEDLTRVYGLVDFGSFTLFGNPLLDVAGAFSYYRMYEADLQQIRAALLPQILARLTDDERRVFFQFVLANALLTCDLYAPMDNPTRDGHFQWALALLANSEYWKQAL